MVQNTLTTELRVQSIVCHAAAELANIVPSRIRAEKPALRCGLTGEPFSADHDDVKENEVPHVVLFATFYMFYCSVQFIFLHPPDVYRPYSVIDCTK